MNTSAENGGFFTCLRDKTGVMMARPVAYLSATQAHPISTKPIPTERFRPCGNASTSWFLAVVSLP